MLTNYQPKIPLRVYSADGKLIGEFGEERRAVVKISQVPKPLIGAIVAAEDERFYQHRGVDYIGVARAAISNFVSGGVRQGASTITMQVARMMAAVANAVADATGVRIWQLPLTPERVLKAFKDMY